MDDGDGYHTWGADQASDFWSLRALVTATLSAAASGISNWSHDIGGYLGHRLVERCPPELFVRWLQFGCFTPLMHAHSRFPHEPWNYGQRMVDTYRAYVLLHEQLVPYTRAAAATAARAGLPIIRPLCLIDPSDPRGWELTDACGYGPALWVAPVLDDGAREREVLLPRATGSRPGRDGACTAALRSWYPRRCSRFRSGFGRGRSSSPTRLSTWRVDSATRPSRSAHSRRRCGGSPDAGRTHPTTTKLADGTRIRWSERSGWQCSDPRRDIGYRVIDA